MRTLRNAEGKVVAIAGGFDWLGHPVENELDEFLDAIEAKMLAQEIVESFMAMGLEDK